MQIKPEHLEQLELEVQHIFDSGANEERVYNMIQAFIEKRGKALFIPIVVDSEVELCGETDYGKVVAIHRFENGKWVEYNRQ